MYTMPMSIGDNAEREREISLCCIWVLLYSQDDYYVLKETSAAALLEKKEQLIAVRKGATKCILGWDVPSSSLKFSSVTGAGKYGDVFSGRMDGKEVTVKTLKPDCGEIAREAFDRELDLLT